MEMLLRGSVGVTFCHCRVVSPRPSSLFHYIGRRRLFVSRRRASAVQEESNCTSQASVVEFPSKHVENVGMRNTKTKQTEDFVLFVEDHSSSSIDGRRQTILLSISPLPILALAALPGAEQITELFTPLVELVRSWNLPEWLIHWGHPGNMAVVLFAMGGYGTYLGWQIRISEDMDLKATAKDLHPKLFAGLFFFFAAGATGGVTSLLTQGKSIFESNHALTGLVGLTLLGIQSKLSTKFEGKPELRSVHAYLGSGIMALFLVHAALGLQLGLTL